MTQRHESKRKYKNNPCTIEKFDVKENHVICPMGERLEFVRENVTVSPSGFETIKRIFEKVGCSNCPLVNQCSKGKDKKTLHYDKEWVERKTKERINFEIHEGEYKNRYEVERCFGVIKHNHRLSRFRHLGANQNLAIWNLQSIAANFSLLIKRTKEKVEQQIGEDSTVYLKIIKNNMKKVANNLRFTTFVFYIKSF